MSQDRNTLDKRLIGISLVSLSIERRTDLLDHFVPLAHCALASQRERGKVQQFTAETIRETIQQSFGITIPLTTMMSLLRKIERSGLGKCLENGKSIQLSANVSFHETTESGPRLRKFSELSQKLAKHLEQNNVVATVEEAQNMLVCLFRENAVGAAQYLAGEDVEQSILIPNSIPSHTHGVLIGFLGKVRNSDDQAFSALLDLFSASYLLALLESTDITNVDTALAQKIEVFLDSNFLLRLLDWQTEFEHEAAKELYNLLLERKATFLVYSFTLTELKSALYRLGNDAFDTLGSMISEGIDSALLNGVASAISRRNLSKVEFLRHHDDIEVTLEELGIQKLEVAEPNEEKLQGEELEKLVQSKKLSKFKASFPERVIRSEAIYDIAAVQGVRHRRRKFAYRFRDAGVFFLTCDARLYRSNREQHMLRKSIPEAILDSRLTDLLWLIGSNSANSIALKQFIANITVAGTLDIATLRDLNRHIQDHMSKNPDDLLYADDIYRSVRETESLEELVRLQDQGREDELSIAIDGQIRKAIESARIEEERVQERLGGLEVLFGDLKSELVKERGRHRDEETKARDENRRLSLMVEQYWSEINEKTEQNRSYKIIADQRFTTWICVLIVVLLAFGAIIVRDFYNTPTWLLGVVTLSPVLWLWYHFRNSEIAYTPLRRVRYVVGVLILLVTVVDIAISVFVP